MLSVQTTARVVVLFTGRQFAIPLVLAMITASQTTAQTARFLELTDPDILGSGSFNHEPFYVSINTQATTTVLIRGTNVSQLDSSSVSCVLMTIGSGSVVLETVIQAEVVQTENFARCFITASEKDSMALWPHGRVMLYIRARVPGEQFRFYPMPNTVGQGGACDGTGPNPAQPGTCGFELQIFDPQNFDVSAWSPAHGLSIEGTVVTLTVDRVGSALNQISARASCLELELLCPGDGVGCSTGPIIGRFGPSPTSTAHQNRLVGYSCTSSTIRSTYQIGNDRRVAVLLSLSGQLSEALPVGGNSTFFEYTYVAPPPNMISANYRRGGATIDVTFDADVVPRQSTSICSQLWDDPTMVTIGANSICTWTSTRTVRVFISQPSLVSTFVPRDYPLSTGFGSSDSGFSLRRSGATYWAPLRDPIAVAAITSLMPEYVPASETRELFIFGPNTISTCSQQEYIYSTDWLRNMGPYSGVHYDWTLSYANGTIQTTYENSPYSYFIISNISMPGLYNISVTAHTGFHTHCEPTCFLNPIGGGTLAISVFDNNAFPSGTLQLHRFSVRSTIDHLICEGVIQMSLCSNASIEDFAIQVDVPGSPLETEGLLFDVPFSNFAVNQSYDVKLIHTPSNTTLDETDVFIKLPDSTPTAMPVSIHGAQLTVSPLSQDSPFHSSPVYATIDLRSVSPRVSDGNASWFVRTPAATEIGIDNLTRSVTTFTITSNAGPSGTLHIGSLNVVELNLIDEQLARGSLYTFEFRVDLMDDAAVHIGALSGESTLQLSSLPVPIFPDSAIVVQPQTGVAMVDVFRIEARSFAADYPLSFIFLYSTSTSDSNDNISVVCVSVTPACSFKLPSGVRRVGVKALGSASQSSNIKWSNVTVNQANTSRPQLHNYDERFALLDNLNALSASTSSQHFSSQNYRALLPKLVVTTAELSRQITQDSTLSSSTGTSSPIPGRLRRAGQSSSLAPSQSPTSPTEAPTPTPTVVPTEAPTLYPTANPTRMPSVVPTASPTMSPTLSPTRSLVQHAPEYIEDFMRLCKGIAAVMTSRSRTYDDPELINQVVTTASNLVNTLPYVTVDSVASLSLNRTNILQAASEVYKIAIEIIAQSPGEFEIDLSKKIMQYLSNILFQSNTIQRTDRDLDSKLILQMFNTASEVLQSASCARPLRGNGNEMLTWGSTGTSSGDTEALVSTKPDVISNPITIDISRGADVTIRSQELDSVLQNSSECALVGGIPVNGKCDWTCISIMVTSHDTFSIANETSLLESSTPFDKMLISGVVTIKVAGIGSRVAGSLRSDIMFTGISPSDTDLTTIECRQWLESSDSWEQITGSSHVVNLNGDAVTCTNVPGIGTIGVFKKCPAGRVGLQCNTTCAAGTYGLGCLEQNNCSVALHGDASVVADPVTGVCNCPAGHTGFACEFLCNSTAGIEYKGRRGFGPNCSSNVRCVMEQTQSYSSETGVCECSNGFSSGTNATCEVDINECASNPCLNGGVCSTPAVGSYQCTCAAGYSGANCANDINECNTLHRVPCQNGNVCANLVGEFKCVDSSIALSAQSVSSVCAAGFKGLYCQEYCDAGYYGPGCQTACNCGAGFCSAVDGSCICPPSTTGGDCSPSAAGAVISESLAVILIPLFVVLGVLLLIGVVYRQKVKRSRRAKVGVVESSSRHNSGNSDDPFMENEPAPPFLAISSDRFNTNSDEDDAIPAVPVLDATKEPEVDSPTATKNAENLEVSAEPEDVLQQRQVDTEVVSSDQFDDDAVV